MVADLFPLAKEAKINFALAREPEDALQIDVYGHMWWWEYVYPDSGVSTANELHIPTGRPVRLTLRTIEPGLPAPQGAEFAQGVLHSFWVPKLAGKTDVVPGRENKLTLEADKPGTYLGQCAEYCNLSHANMRLRVDRPRTRRLRGWVAEQTAAGGQAAPSGPAAQGSSVFTGKGVASPATRVGGHRGRGGPGRPQPHPPHSRVTPLPGPCFDNTPENLRRWLDDPSAVKPMRPDRRHGHARPGPDRGRDRPGRRLPGDARVTRRRSVPEGRPRTPWPWR